MMGARIRRLEGETVKRAVVGLVFLVALWGAALAQEYVGAWAVTEKVDAFTDERQVTLVIGENGEYAEANSNAVLALICTEDQVKKLQVQFRDSLGSEGGEVERAFDYRLDSGPVLSGQAWVNGRVMAVIAESNPETFKALSDALLAGEQKLRIRVQPASGDPLTAIFLPDQLQAALAAAGCTVPSVGAAPDEPSDEGDAGGDEGGDSSSP